MSRLDALIQTLCPNGVRYCELKELANIGTGNSNRIDACDGGEYPFFVRSKQVMRSCKFDFDEEAIIIPGEGGIGEIFHYIQGKYDLHQRAYRISFRNQDVNTKFAYYYMLANFKKHIMLKAVTATVISIRRPMIDSFRLAVPPLPVQEEIVRILDTFTNVVEVLETELDARVRQYEYYRDGLLNFNESDITAASSPKIRELIETLCPDGVKYEVLDDLATISRGVRVVKNQLTEKGEFPVYQNSLVPMGFFEESNCTANTTFIISAGAAGEIGYSSVDFWAADDCFFFVDHERLHSKFLYYSILRQQKYLFSQVRRASVPRLARSIVEQLLIPVPPLPVQEEIVAVLDRFDTLTNNLKSGLPAEIAARRKQYEYYRDKLLTFPPLK